MKNRYMAVNARFIITIVGAESSGKSTLVRRLADYFKGPWVPEYARDYLGGIKRPYDVQDLEVIAGRQMQIIENEIGCLDSSGVGFDTSNVRFDSAQRTEDFKSGDVRFDSSDVRFDSAQRSEDFKSEPFRFDSAQRPENEFINLLESIKSKIQNPKSKIKNPKSKILIVDGGMLNLRMWARIKYGISLPVIEEGMLKDETDLYILCRPLNTWSEDPLREAPRLLDRAWIYNQYLQELQKNKLPFIIWP